MKISTYTIAEFLTIAVKKICDLSPAEFEKMRGTKLMEENYLLRKWQEKDGDFPGIYLNLDSTNRQAFVKYCGIETEVWEHSNILADFLMFCCNYDSPNYRENPFAGRYKELLYQKATGRKKIIYGVKAEEAVKLFNNLDWNGKCYLVNCCFAKKKQQSLIIQ